MSSKPRVALGMSGGVDSSTTAALLKNAGYEVVGVTCLFCQNDSAESAIRDARIVADQLGIEHVVKDYREEFKRMVMNPFVAEYVNGNTPIPCVCCNEVCKFPALLDIADELNCEYVATGHYAQIVQDEKTGRFAVHRAADSTKDQSYMLSRLHQDQLSRILLPLGNTTKKEVRAEAHDFGLATADRPESQDVCFIPKDYRTFLAEQGVEDTPGNIVNVAGEVLGTHTGLFNYTVGQRKGIGVAAERPYYVIGKRAATNELVIGFKEQSLITEVEVKDCIWQASDIPSTPFTCGVKLRYRSQVAPCEVRPESDGSVRILLQEAQLATAPGQAAVFYDGDVILGSGIIERTHAAWEE